MKLKVINPNNIIQNAFTRQNDLSFNLIINTVKKWLRPSRILTTEKHLAVIYGDPYQASPDSVNLFAENNLDMEIFHRLRFELLDTDQLWILFPADEVTQFNNGAKYKWSRTPGITS